MSKSKSAAPAAVKNVAGTIAREVAAIINAGHSFAAAAVVQRTAEKDTQAKALATHARQIVAWSDGLKGCPAITTREWDATMRDVIRTDLLKHPELYDAKSVGIVLNRMQQFTIARTNGFVPQVGESVEKYLKRVSPEIKAQNLYIPKNAGGNPVNAAKSQAIKDDKGQVVSRELAAFVLANGDKPRAAMLNFLTLNHMDKLVALATELMPKA